MTRDNVNPTPSSPVTSARESERPSSPLEDLPSEHQPKTDSVPKNLKDSPAAQFEYGRKTQHATERYDRSSRRLEHGNPDVGEIDLGNIEADKPAQPDDNDLYD